MDTTKPRDDDDDNVSHVGQGFSQSQQSEYFYYSQSNNNGNDSQQQSQSSEHHWLYHQSEQGSDHHFSSESQLSSPPTQGIHQGDNDDESNEEEEEGENRVSNRDGSVSDLLSPTEVIRRIEKVTRSVVKALSEEKLPELKTFTASDSSSSSNDSDTTDLFGGSSTLLPITNGRRFVFHNMTQCRTFSSIMLVLSFCHSLLLAQRTTTTREVYYFYVTHFRSQKECDTAIVEAANLLQVPRSSLGLYASPKGWFCGCIQIVRDGRVVMDGQAQSSMQGAPITQEWLTPSQQRDFTIDCRVIDRQRSSSNRNNNSRTGSRAIDHHRSSSNHHSRTGSGRSDNNEARPPPPRRAKCILVIEKEGVYNRLSEDRLYERYPCILVTGKGFPDLATRSLVHSLHHELQLPVYGVADCNPYGVLVLQTYQYGSERLGVDGGSRYSVPIQWLGLRPSQVERIGEKNATAPFPPSVFQSLTDLDRKRLEKLLDEDHRFHECGSNEYRYEELKTMEANGYKMELEALNWLGMDFMANWIYQILIGHEEQLNEQQGVHDPARMQSNEDSQLSDEGEDDDEEDNDDEDGDDVSLPNAAII